MAPRKSEAVVITPWAVSNGLSGDAAQQLVALNQLSSPAAAAFSQDDIIASGILSKIVNLLQQQDKSSRLLSCKLLASYAAGEATLQQALCSPETLQALWSVLTAYQASEASIATLLADPVAVKAAVAARRSAGPDPEEWLPGPSKYLLEAALRAIASLISRGDAEQQEHQAQTEKLADEGTTDSTNNCIAAQQLHCWAVEQDVAVLVCLLKHPSYRVQMRAARLAHQLARSRQWADGFTAAGGVHAAVHLLGSTNNTAVGHKTTDQTKLHTLLLAVLRLLLRIANLSAAGVVALAQQPQLLSTLMQQLLDSASATVQGKAKAAAAAAATVTTDARLGPSAATAVQQGAAELLAFLCARSSSMSAALLQAGGLAALQQLLPEPPHWQFSGMTEASVTSRGIDDVAVTTANKPMQNAVTSTTAEESVSCVGMNATPRAIATGTTPTAAGTPRMTATTAEAAAHPATRSPTGQGQSSAIGMVGAAADVCHTPAGKLGTPELQASVLQVIAAVLSHEGAVQSLLMQPAATQASLPRMLLYFFTPATIGLSTADSVSTLHVEGMAAQNFDAAMKLSTAAAVKTSTSSATGKGGGNATARRSAVGSVADLTGVTTSNPASVTTTMTPPQGLTPRKPLATSGKNPDALSPPFSSIVKGAALDCLVHLTQDKQAVALLAEQKVAVSSGSESRPETSAAGDQQQTSQGDVSSEGVSMLQLLLQDLHLLACSNEATTADMLQSSITATTEGTKGGNTGASASAPLVQQQTLALPYVDAAATVLAGLAEHFSTEQQQLPLLPALKALARRSIEHTSQVSLHTQQAVARTLLLLPEALYVAPARPPLPSPPPTPPAPPLPTSQFAWDALGRPLMTDGAVLVSNA